MTARRFLQAIAATVLGAATLLAAVGPMTAHSPDPVLSGALWAQDQVVRYRWRAGEVPPAAIQAAINAAAADANRSRLSRAATFVSDPTGPSWINYGLDVACGVNGLACFSRVNAPNSFTMSFREQGHVFDWGALRWCQTTPNAPNGCYDVENIALDEFGHVEILNHHVNFADDHDYLDAVVQTFSHTKPNVGWNAHAFGRCDVASLQRRYDVPNTASKYSTCLDLATTLTLTTSAPSVPYDGSATLTAKLIVTDLDAYERMGGNAAAGRAVTIQRRTPGGTWVSLTSMTAGANGTYQYVASSLRAPYEWRAIFAKPSTEGLRGATSNAILVSLSSGCSSAPCPLSGTVR
jgi:hypothetical protein